MTLSLTALPFNQEWPLVLAQLEDRSLPTPEVRSSNPVTRKLFIEHLLTVKTKIKNKGLEQEFESRVSQLLGEHF